jgi:hypothetical protein
VVAVVALTAARWGGRSTKLIASATSQRSKMRCTRGEPFDDDQTTVGLAVRVEDDAQGFGELALDVMGRRHVEFAGERDDVLVGRAYAAYAQEPGDQGGHRDVADGGQANLRLT